MESLNINNYKCFKSIEIQGLERVNLFTGKNNVGKSTVLEALSLYASRGNNDYLLRLLEDRGEITTYTNEYANVESNTKLLSTFFTDRKVGYEDRDKISIKCDSEILELGFEKFNIVDKVNLERLDISEEDKLISNNYGEIRYGLKITNSQDSRTLMLENRLFRQFVRVEPLTFHYINASGNINKNIASIWDKIVLTGQEDIVVEALKIIEPEIIRLSFIGDEIHRDLRHPMVKLGNGSGYIPLKSMGDGINRILSIIMALVNAADGLLLIDEFENELHYSAQEELWRIIFVISKKLKVQLFVTTHSSDAIKSFATVLEEQNEDSGKLYRLARKNEKIKVFPFTENEIILASQQEINLR